jgi:dihydropteroate synthase
MSKSSLIKSPVVMGVLNVTPDSFSDGGEFDGVERAVARAKEMIEEGAQIIDVGGESTGPGSVDVHLEEELGRVIPVIQAIHEQVPGALISVDTWKSEVARQAIEAGARMVNDVTALRGDEDMARVVAEADVPVVIMYSKDGSARTTGEAMEYEDVVASVRSFLEERIRFAEEAGISRKRIVVDPGMGAFVSGVAKYSLALLEKLEELQGLGCPVLVGASRKSFIRDIWGGDRPGDRLKGSLEAAKLAVKNGASIVRVHDVRETVSALGLDLASVGA